MALLSALLDADLTDAGVGPQVVGEQPARVEGADRHRADVAADHNVAAAHFAGHLERVQGVLLDSPAVPLSELPVPFELLRPCLPRSTQGY